MPIIGGRAASVRGLGFQGAGAPAQVTGLTATDFGTSRAYNNGRIDLAWTAPANNGAPITGYFIERSTNSGSTWSTLVANTGNTTVSYSNTGLSSAQIYYYRVSAINVVGTGTASSSANATATTVPQAPTIGTPTAGDGSVSVAFTAGATGGKSVSTYTATSSPGSITGTAGSSPITVSGLTNGTAYTFTVTATNANGTSAASSASASVTPQVSYWLAYGAAVTQVYADSSGNIYNCGRDSVNGGGMVGKISPAGQFIWQMAYYNGSAYDENLDAVTSDSSGNVYTVGRVSSVALGVLFKFNSSGTLQWQKRIETVSPYSQVQPNSIITDSSGNVYVGGHAQNADLGRSVPIIWKFDSSGALVWIRWACYAQGGSSNGIGIDSSNNLYLAWNPQGSNKGKVTKYSSAGVRQWDADTTTGLISLEMAADSSGNNYHLLKQSNDLVIIKNNSSSTTQWARKLALGYEQAGTGISVDSSGNVYIVSNAYNGTKNIAYIIKYNTSGTIQWQRSFTGPLGQSGLQIAVTPSGVINIIGNSDDVPDKILLKLPSDGSKTGTYTLNGKSFTYAASSQTASTTSDAYSTISPDYSGTSGFTMETSSYTVSSKGYTITKVTI